MISKFSLEFSFDINLLLRVAEVIGLEPHFSIRHVEFSIVLSIVLRIVGLIVVGIVASIVASIVLRAWGCQDKLLPHRVVHHHHFSALVPAATATANASYDSTNNEHNDSNNDSNNPSSQSDQR